MAKQTPFWMVSPKNLIGLVGAEFDLIQQSGGKVLKRFYLTASFIILIMIVSFLSIFYAVALLTHIPLVEIILASFLSLLFVFIFIFLINTFAKEKNTNVNKGFFVFSNVTRAGFVLFIAFVISKPIELFAFKNRLTTRVEEYKKTLLSEHTSNLNKIFQPELTTLEQRINDLTVQNGLFKSNVFNDEIAGLSKKINSLSERKKQMTALANAKIETSGYFIYRIKTVLNNYPFTWVICLAIIILFGLPILLIYSISGDAQYFLLKKQYERSIISSEYTAFTKKYTEIFKNNFGISIGFYSKYDDPPFNTVLKERYNFKSSAEFLNKYCPD